ncbi:MAG TPA: hypothetical protein PLD20_10595 [Blastocatellia bacterium]|nr:hypothetical protein [Blastocatellia bacterium]HMV85378.1 hypothetical protein [Blastocatellia bacterium]HMX24490.1 hypothetical protein [Blastocatellia bacterium]HMY70408.1 hypothetical protein [Blastocatellia bacterium]HMZ18368.1 hypothetical protein [Blastocatellia bacterium]
MAFSDYKNIGQVQKEFGIRYREENFIPLREVIPSTSFQSEFEFNRRNIDVFTSEASRTDLVITPILREVYKQYHERYSFWIQKSISYNDKLNGTPDYIIATRSALGKTVLELPLVMVVEAKKNDFEQGWGQCLAELVAAQRLNGNATAPVYGIVTDGELWKFGKLAEDSFVSNIEGCTINNLGRLFGSLDFIFQSASNN